MVGDDLGELPGGVLEEVRGICLGLPEAHEERAWVGVRWRIRARTFAHLLAIEGGRPEAHARAAGTSDAVVLVFRSGGDEYDVLCRQGLPFFAARWGRQDVGIVLGDRPDWDEVAELLTESYCLLAPKGLAAVVPRPAPDR